MQCKSKESTRFFVIRYFNLSKNFFKFYESTDSFETAQNYEKRVLEYKSNTESENLTTKVVKPNIKRKSTIPLIFQTSTPPQSNRTDKTQKRQVVHTKKTSIKPKEARTKKKNVKNVQDDSSTTFTDDSSSLSDVPDRPTKSLKIVNASEFHSSHSSASEPIISVPRAVKSSTVVTSGQVSTLEPYSSVPTSVKSSTVATSAPVSVGLESLESHEMLLQILGKVLITQFYT